MVEGKVLGIDGLSSEFYKAYWDFVVLDLYQLYLKSMRLNSLGHLINKGNIKFIHKPRDSEIINKWRPITSLNVSYMILAKALALLL